MDSNIKHLYDTMISRGYTGLGDFSNFEGKMKDSGKRKLVYDHLMQDDYFSEIGDFSKFESALGYSPAKKDSMFDNDSFETGENEGPKDSYLKDLGESFMQGVGSLGKIALSPVKKAADYINESDIGKAINERLGLEGGQFGQWYESADKMEKEYAKRSDRYGGKDFIQLLKDGRYADALGEVFLSATKSAPTSLGIMAASAAGSPAAGLALMGAGTASEKYDQLGEENPDMGSGAKMVNSLFTGLFEAGTEYLGAGAAGTAIRQLLKSAGREAAGEAIKKSLMQKSADFMKKHYIVGPIAEEAMEETVNALGEYITDKLTGVERDDNILETMLKSGVYGAAGGAQYSPIIAGARLVGDKMSKNNAKNETPPLNGQINMSESDQGVNTPPQFTKSIIDDAFEQGRNMSDKGDFRDLSLQMEASRTALTEKNPNLAIRMEQYIDNGASENQINEMLKGVDNETRELAYDFYINTQKIKGVEDKSIENINNEVDSYMSDNIIPYVSISPNGRQVISTATFKEGLENKKVYIRSINGDNVIISDNGNNRMVPMSSLSDIEENDVEQIRNSYRQQLLVTRQSELDMAMNHNPKTQLPKPGLVIWNGDNAFILQGQDENGDWIAQPAALDKETGQVAPKAGSAPAMPITERDILALQDAMYDSQQANEVSLEDDSVASADAEITSAPPVEDAINQPTSEIETEGAIDQIAQPSNVENPSMVMREDGTPDFVSSGTDMALDFLHDKYGEKMPRKIEVTRKSFDEILKKASDALEKAQEAYDDAPIGKEDKAEAALIKARQEYEAIKVEADFWANLDDDIKEASKKPGDVIAKEISVIGDPMSGEELAAMMLANGAIKLTRDSYKKETGAGNNETARMFGLFASPEKGGVNIERAGEILELADRENGTNFFDENDTNAGRDAIIEVLSSAHTRGDLIDYVKRNREAIAERERLAEYNAYAEWCEENYHMSPEEYEAYEESMARDFSEKQLTDEERGELDSQIVDEIQAIIDEQNEIDAILAQNKPIENENIEGNDESGGDGLREGGGEVLPREQLDQTGGTGEVEGRESAGPDIDRTDGATQEGSSRGLVPFVAPSPKENETPLDYAERIVQAKRLHDEELKVDTNPSEAQKEAGNYKKGHIKINGFDVSIEQPVGSVRSGKDASGKEWSQVMNNTYGYIRGTESVDGDHIDVFLGPDMNSDMVYVVDQVNTDGSFDEHKVMIGFSSLEDARSAYLSNYEDGWQGLGNITGVALDEFKKWIDSSKRKTKPFSEYKGIKREEEILPRKVKKLSLVDKDGYITAAERRHIKAFLESGLEAARVNNSIYEISNIGDDGVYEIVRRFNYTDPLTLVKDENGKLVNKRGEGEHVIRVKPTFEEIRPDSGIRFREVKDKNGEKSLVGLHNISEEKLRKALRQGGFANPSAAVIDISRQSHTGYGSISLVLPSSMIEKRTGKNAGTWSQDAWTPIYPTIERQFSGKGSDAFSKDLQKLPEEMRSTTKSGMDSYMDGRGEDSLAYMYLYEQGKAPEIARTKPSYPEKTRTEVEDATNGSFSMSGLSDKQLSRLKDAYMEYKGFSTEGYNEAIKLRRAKLEEAIGKMNPRSILYEKRKTDLERIDKYGFDYSAVESFMKSVRDDISNSDKVDAHGTMRDSWNFIEENGMRGDFNKWLDKLNERYGIKEIIFNGFTPSGIRKYIPNTLENVSKFMKKQGRSASVGIGASFQNFAASLLDAKGSLKDIRKDKGKLTTDHADVDAFRDKWSKVFHELGEKLQPDAKGYDDYGLYRLAEAARSKDPQKYIKEEYGIDFSDEDVKTLNEMVDAIRNEYPAMYFETKFERPVYLEEFAAAVVPDNVDGDIRKAIYDAGLKIFTYKADDEISRNEAVKQASEIDGVRFRSIGEKGAANLNNAETIESSINDWSNKLNTPVRVIHDVDDITDTDENMLARKRDSKGWYDTSTGEIVIVSPNSTSVGDAQRTFLHEVVGHHGLRELFGDDFDTFLDNVYRNANEDIRKNIIDRTKGNPLNLREATEEYIAELAERGFDNKAERSLWEKIKDAFLDMLRKAGISLDFKLSDNDLRYILWRSYKNLEQGNLMDVAEDTVMRNDLGIGDFSVRFREAKTEVENEEPLNKEMVDAWDKVASSDSFKFKEAMVDSLTAIDEFLKLLAKKTKSKILDYENPYYALIALSSKNKADMDSFDSKFLNPLNEAIRALIGDASEVSKKGLRITWDWSKGPLRDLVKYVQSKHGIERNRDMSVRDGIETLKAFDVDALSKMGVISDSDLKNAKKTAEKVAEEKGSEAYKKTYDKVLGKELKKGVDKGKAERSAEIAADYRKSFVKSEIYNKEMDKYKEKVTGTLIDRWEDSKKDVLNKDLAWDEEQKELDREALSFQWKLGDNSYGVILGKDYSGLSSVFKPSEDGANKDKWLSDAYDFVRDYESTHNMVLVDNLWDKVHNVSEYTLRRQYESGLISKSYMDKNLSRFKYFIPLRGFSDNIASDVYDYIDATEIKMGNPVKTAKGRISEADNPFAGLIHVGYGSITAGNRNLAKQRFLNLASNHDTGGLITIDNIWVRNVGTEENPEWVESIPQIPDNASGEEVAKAVKDHEEMMRELREEGKAELIKGGRSDIPYKTLYDQRSQHQVQVFVGGNRYVMTVNGNPRLAQAVNGLTNPDVKDDLAYVVARNLKTFMAGAFTSKNVAFSFANLIRDTPYANNSVFVTENFRYFKDFSGNQRRALFGLRSLGRNLYKYRRGEIDISDKEQAIFKEFMDNGGATGYTFVETQKEYAKDLANKLEKLSDGNIGKLSPKELVSTVFECFEFMGNVAELVNRYAAYKTSREHGRSIDRSINDAKEVSVNFNKKGAGKKTKSDKWYINTAAWISEYGRDWVLFFNAAVQSMYKEYSMLRNHPIKGIGSRIAPLIFMGSSVSLLNNMFMPMLFAYLGWDSDDDDRDYFDSLSDHERQNNICIRLTHGRWLKIPLSPELANYFKIGDIIAGQLSGKREVEAMDVVKTGIDMVSPLNINWEYDSWKFALNLLPTVVQPIAQNASNVNFMGNPIYKTSMNKANDYDPEYTKVYRSTSTTMVELSRALNSLTGGDDVKRGLSFNPATWQNIFSGYTGGFGTVALGVSDLVLDILSGEDGDMPVSRYPLLSRFLTGGDKDLKLSRMSSIYNKKVVDFVSEMDHDYKGYLEKSMDPSINILDRAEYIVKLEKFMKSDDFKKSQELSQYVRAISDMERFLREVGSDNDSLENQVYELKLRALEIFEDE
nr:MAG TPA: Type I restriction enzyme [Caudoviricetes sp.]